MTRVRAAALLGLVVAIVVGAVWVARARAGTAPPLLPRIVGTDASARAPANVRIRVQVLNTTRTRGLARQATRLLRRRGFDVVEMGTTGPTLDSTLVLDRSGHPEWAALVGQGLGAARVVARPDSSRYLDVTVLLGRLWRPPPQPLDP